jgi:NADH dehydrogenase FAD-containing subunit
MSERRKVVIIGGGFGGLSAAQHLNSSLVDSRPLAQDRS